ncbi:hypothetical protein STW0522ENT51_33890 [Enterobacter kobei]|nr:hypothetical protein STW0522ENT51_33890 [Enterobacter kobei]
MSATALVTEFLLAAEEGNVDALKACLEKGVDINATNRQKRTAIIIASLKKHYACVEFLIAAGAGNDSNLLIVFYVQIMPDDLVMQLHRF